ncbi:MAG: hypothetical protein KTR14_10630 [Vampirovibrio sp.]|nr:hypothetical protein [Vampirovibrio sp.]
MNKVTPQNILIVGNDDDKIVQVIAKQCEQAGHQVTRADGLEVLTLEEESEFHTVFSCLTGFYAVNEVCTKVKVTDDTLFIVSCLYDHAVGSIQRDDLVVGFSPLALYWDSLVVELASTMNTSDATMNRATALMENIGLKAYTMKETPGLVMPRILATLANEAAYALMEGIASAEDIDTAMKLGTNYPEGPLRWADKIGIDVIYDILQFLYTEYREDRYRAAPLITRMMLAGKVGEKVGEGFYTYSEANKPVPAGSNA